MCQRLAFRIAWPGLVPRAAGVRPKAPTKTPPRRRPRRARPLPRGSQYRLSMMSYAADIKPLFRERDRGAMLSHFDLWSYDDVAERAQSCAAPHGRNGARPSRHPRLPSRIGGTGPAHGDGANVSQNAGSTTDATTKRLRAYLGPSSRPLASCRVPRNRRSLRIARPLSHRGERLLTPRPDAALAIPNTSNQTKIEHVADAVT